jgi:hypothetical protein
MDNNTTSDITNNLEHTLTSIAVHVMMWIFSIKATPPPSKIDFGLGTFKSLEIWRICWGYSGEAMIKFSAPYHDV